MYQGDGFTAFIHEEILSQASPPGWIRFHLGAWGWCSVTLVECE